MWSSSTPSGMSAHENPQNPTESKLGLGARGPKVHTMLGPDLKMKTLEQFPYGTSFPGRGQ
jgi:hypothetical protein